MKRKEWLETFIMLAGKNSPAVAYRKHLRLKLNTLSGHVKNLGRYIEELRLIELREAAVEAELEREEKLKAKKLSSKVESTMESAADAGAPYWTEDEQSAFWKKQDEGNRDSENLETPED